MKKIVCLIDDLCPGGAQRQLVGLAYLLKESGYDISVMTYHNDSFYMPVLSIMVSPMYMILLLNLRYVGFLSSLLV